MTEAVIEAFEESAPDRIHRTKQAAKPKQRALSYHMPRRFKDHRRAAAKRYAEYYRAVIEQHPPKGKLGFLLAGMLADLLLDYGSLRRGKKPGTKSARRKTTGLIFGCLREVRASSSPHGHGPEAEDLARLLAQERE